MKTHVVKISPDALIREAVDQMDIYQVDSMPVADEEGKLIGMISDTDILATLATISSAMLTNFSELDTTAAKRSVSELMTWNPISVHENQDAQISALALLRSGMNRIAVVSDDNVVVGTLNRIDVFQAFFDSDFDVA